MDSEFEYELPLSSEDAAKIVLIAHQRRDIRSCLCGWSELGMSHCAHQAQMLAEAGLLKSDP